MGFCDEIELNNADVNRIAKGMDIDFSKFDAVLDFSPPWKSDFTFFGM